VAHIVDQVGNQGASATDNAILDLNGPVAPVVTILEDSNDDGLISASELDGPIDALIDLPTGAMAGDILTISDGTVVLQVTLTAQDISTGSVTAAFPAPVDGSPITVTAFVTDQIGNKGAEGSDTAMIDTSGPSAPTVIITEDINNDGYLSADELSGLMNVAIQLPADAKAGDVLTVIGPAGPQSIVLDPDVISSGLVSLEFPRPNHGQSLQIEAYLTDPAGNSSPKGSDAVMVDLVPPSAPTVLILEDANDDGYIGPDENAPLVRIRILLPEDVQIGDVLTVLINGEPVAIVINEQLFAAGQVDLTTPSLADGETLEVSAHLTDPAGNSGDSSVDSAIFDLSPPEPPTVVILEDKNGDGWLDEDEIDGPVDVHVHLPSGARRGDKLVVTNGFVSYEVELSDEDIEKGFVAFEFEAPVNGAAIKVEARLIDAAGNSTEPAEESALRQPDPATESLRTFRGKDFDRLSLRDFLKLTGEAGVYNYEIRSVVGLPEGASLRIEGDFIYFDGVSEVPSTVSIVIEATDSGGNRFAGNLTLEVEDIPTVEFTDEVAILSRQTGLFEQRIQVTNTSSLAIEGFEVAVEGLSSGVSLYNASRLNEAGVAHVAYSGTLAAGETIQFALEYFTLNRSAIIRPDFTFLLGTQISAPTEGAVLESVRVVVLSAGVNLLDFATVPGAVYAIQYSDDLAVWKTVRPSVMAAGNRVIWIDEGPPKTDSDPTSDRYYRVIQID
jgi:hypothetical protein